VQVSYEDVQPFARWAGKQLPTEADGSFAAPGGLERATYVWSNDSPPGGKQMARRPSAQASKVEQRQHGLAGWGSRYLGERSA